MIRITCKKLSKKYPENVVALDNVNLSLEMGGIFALIGRNGAGKTTLVKILSTTLLPTSGSARIDGADVVKNAGVIRDRVAVVPQEARPIPWMTPREWITAYLMWRGLSYGSAGKKADESLRLLGISKTANTMHSKLSGGTKRKVLVATVIATDADIIFLDEPTTGLDPLSRSEMWELLEKLKKDRFIFLTTHYLEEAEALADKIGVLEEGKLLGLGSLSELRKRTGFPYSIKILQKKAHIKVRKGRVIKGMDGRTQIFTTEKETGRLSKQLIKEGVKFSTNPVSLEDVFYSFVKKKLDEDNGSSGDEEW